MTAFKTLYQSLKLETPIGPDDPAYVNYYAAGSKYGYTDDPINELATSISFGDNVGSALHFVTGQRGTGKSSELLRLKKILEADGYAVWLTDLSALFDLSEPVEISDFLIGAASSLIEQLGIGAAESKDGFFAGLHQFFTTEVKVDGLKLGADALGLQAELDFAFSQNPTIRETLRQALRARVDAIWRQTADFVERVAAKSQKRVVWIMDSIDRLAGRFDNAQAVADSVVVLFSQHADKLRFKHVRTVAVVHPWLSSAAGAALRPDGWTFLPSIRVRSRDGQPDPIRVQILKDISLRRYPDLYQLIAEPQVEAIALMSGGDLREYFALLRSCAVKAGSSKAATPIAANMVERVFNEARNEMLPLANDEIEWMRAIHKHKSPDLSKREEVLELARLLNGKFVMNYRNGDDWYDIHPLLLAVIAPTPN